uniref:Uncharacterized protein n=1 Tax=Arundo donax TaxID=35708 RepID=A0A0A9A2X1_ARUDO
MAEPDLAALSPELPRVALHRLCKVSST